MRPWLKIAVLVVLAGIGALWLTPAGEGPGVTTGNAAPPLVLPELAGRERALSSLAGRAVVVNFWATWCPPCKEELPELVESWKQLRGRCVEFLAVTEESAREDVIAEVGRFQVPYPVLVDGDGAVARAWGVTGLPRTFVVDGEGKIRKSFTGRVSRSRLEAALLPLIPASCPGA